ncbi:MAG TPA: hypothetical protein PKA56_04430 [Solirubrobacterales bacterium]|nr:hypothetical protein [Solirubrobacterales bacterium]HMW44740.1 hypothetical protein [Solirubrobacterales bacterium]HMX70979.1 hypothetical protein [Solirubrobacterales bacterium]HMY26414.1 hypothetical protein [Solirubrobacterales bacterium]HNA23312.1 hypothetical protein [Solirubrobacterales bacterium]
MAEEPETEVAAASDPFIESLMDTDLYSMGAYFSDRNPELIDELIDRSVAIEERGLVRFSEEEDMELEQAFKTLITGLAVRYYKSVTG